MSSVIFLQFIPEYLLGEVYFQFSSLAPVTAKKKNKRLHLRGKYVAFVPVVLMYRLLYLSSGHREGCSS
jgi:hypothetical protein